MEIEELAPKQQIFVSAYPKTFNVEKAADEAGLTYDWARKLCTKPHIQAALAESVKRSTKILNIDAGWVLAEAAAMYKECRAEGEFPTAARCLEIVGKHVDVRAFEQENNPNLHITMEDSKWTIEVVHVSNEAKQQAIEHETLTIEKPVNWQINS